MLVAHVVVVGALFSSLSESGFIPTAKRTRNQIRYKSKGSHLFQRVASFLQKQSTPDSQTVQVCSHLFQRVASFLRIKLLLAAGLFSSSSHLFQRVASFLPREKTITKDDIKTSSHLFQRVASFLPGLSFSWRRVYFHPFSSLSESGFIPTPQLVLMAMSIAGNGSHLFQRVASFLQPFG